MKPTDPEILDLTPGAALRLIRLAEGPLPFDPATDRLLEGLGLVRSTMAAGEGETQATARGRELVGAYPDPPPSADTLDIYAAPLSVRAFRFAAQALEHAMELARADERFFVEEARGRGLHGGLDRHKACSRVDYYHGCVCCRASAALMLLTEPKLFEEEHVPAAEVRYPFSEVGAVRPSQAALLPFGAPRQVYGQLLELWELSERASPHKLVPSAVARASSLDEGRAVPLEALDKSPGLFVAWAEANGYAAGLCLEVNAWDPAPPEGTHEG